MTEKIKIRLLDTNYSAEMWVDVKTCLLLLLFIINAVYCIM